MKVLIIGFGSIGKRHFEILKSFKGLDGVDVVTKQKVNHIHTYPTLEKVKDLHQYDYFVIASETVKHYEQLNYICLHTEHKKILVEKPLYNKINPNIETNNKIFTAYNLRFHPIIIKLKEWLQNSEVYYANIVCGQYLPTWRPEQDYRNSYSASLREGGGVLRDLSHELDYASWLFGDIQQLQFINTKISDLEICSDDIFTAIGVTDYNTIVNISMDYISKVPIRRLVIHTREQTIEADMIQNTIAISSKDGTTRQISQKSIDRNETYRKMHESIIEEKYEMVCSFEEGLKIVDMIGTIEYKDLK